MTIHKKLTTTMAAAGLAVGAVALADTPARADILHLDDVIITFSLCVGNDCVNGENFGFDTLRLKENNLRIHFNDTSSTASFPSNDWRIVINDSSNGGDNFFRIEDSTGGKSPFQIDAGAPSNSLRVDSAGDVGIGTANPVLELHVVDGDSPSLRLEQNGSSGFTPQTFDLVANEANFFIRDVTNGSKLPFRIKPGAPSESIYIAEDGDISMGSDNPNVNNTGDDLVVFDNGPARLLLFNNSQNGNKAWTLNSNNTLRISAGGDATEFELQENGNVEFGGTCIEFDANAGTRFACTFSAGGGVSCAAAGSSCP